MKHLLRIFLCLFLFNSLSAQNNSLSFKKQVEENDQFFSMVKNALLSSAPKPKGVRQTKSFTFDRYQYDMKWDTATSSWDTLAKFTYYSNQISAGIIEYSGYVDLYQQNSILRRDSVYMKVDSNLNVYKIPYGWYADYVSIISRFIIDTTNNQYRKYAEDSITSNSSGNITRSSYNRHRWNPGQPTTISTEIAHNYYYSSNGPINYFISLAKNFFGSGYSQDSTKISADNNYYPLDITEYEKQSTSYAPKTKHLYTYNSNHDKIRDIYQFYQPGLSNFTTVSENRLTYANGLLQTDSLFGGSGGLRDFRRYYYNTNNLLDSSVVTAYSPTPNPIVFDTILSWYRYEYDTQDRLTLRTFLYPISGNYLQGSRTWNVYPQVSTSLQEGEQSKNEISFYPNPADDNIIIDGKFNEIGLQISNTAGKLVKVIDNLHPSDIILIEDLSSGVYFLTFENGETKKLIKQ